MSIKPHFMANLVVRLVMLARLVGTKAPPASPIPRKPRQACLSIMSKLSLARLPRGKRFGCRLMCRAICGFAPIIRQRTFSMNRFALCLAIMWRKKVRLSVLTGCVLTFPIKRRFWPMN